MLKELKYFFSILMILYSYFLLADIISQIKIKKIYIDQ